MSITEAINDHFKPLFEEARRNNDTSHLRQLSNKNIDSLNSRLIGIGPLAHHFVWTHPSCPVSAYAIQYTYGYYSADDCIYLYHTLDTSVQKLSGAKKFLTQNMNLKNTDIGKTAPDFTFEDQKGQRRALSSFKHKAILLTFWTHYCRPCREENRRLSPIYTRYHNHGLEIISVYLGKRDTTWFHDMNIDSINCVSTTDGEYNHSPLFTQYGIFGFPYQVLMDSEHKIIARAHYINYLEDSIKHLLQN